MLVIAISCLAQKRTLSATMFKEFLPSVITFTDGHTSAQPLTNVFLKNSSLLYLRGDYTMEANMENIAAVDFPGGRSFVTINNQLAYKVDSVGKNLLLCVELFEENVYTALDLVLEEEGWAHAEVREDLTRRPRVLVAVREGA